MSTSRDMPLLYIKTYLKKGRLQGLNSPLYKDIYRSLHAYKYSYTYTNTVYHITHLSLYAGDLAKQTAVRQNPLTVGNHDLHDPLLNSKTSAEWSQHCCDISISYIAVDWLIRVATKSLYNGNINRYSSIIKQYNSSYETTI